MAGDEAFNNACPPALPSPVVQLIQAWPPGLDALEYSRDCYQASPDSPMAALLCGICQMPMGSTPFELVTLVCGTPCEQGAAHVASLTIGKHVICKDLPGDEMSPLILGRAGPCAG